MRTATFAPWFGLPSLFTFFLAFFSAFFGGLAMASADLGLGHHGAGLEHAGLAHACDHLQTLPHRHLGHLPHQRPHLVELAEELLDLMRLCAAAGRDAPPPAQVDHVRVAALLLGHRVDHALDALDRLLGILALWNHVAHAGHLGHQVAHAAHFGHHLELLAEVVKREVAFFELLLLAGNLFLRQLGL